MPHRTVLCRYTYDPLDRLATRTPTNDAFTRSFYRAERLATEIQGAEQRSFLHREHQLLALHTLAGKRPIATLAATDQHHSVLNTATSGQSTLIAYAPFGHREPIRHLPGFNGEQPDPLTGHYLLGKGYRAYNPVLMRFNSPDSLSPFGEGGLNPYAYCLGDPVNRLDPTGHVPWQLLVGVGLTITSFLISGGALFPSLPFMLSMQAAQVGFVSAGSLSTIVAGTSGVAVAVLGITRTVLGELVPDSPLLEPLGWITLALGIVSSATRIGSIIAARNPQNLTDIQNVAVPRLISRRSIPLDSFDASPRLSSAIDIRRTSVL
ncbi:RHS repeat-associated core domain-containing protein [Pseudomonas cichorii]|nr:RHS repeat-associated core domain-containing protein [Pseudomonas cichorii]